MRARQAQRSFSMLFCKDLLFAHRWCKYRHDDIGRPERHQKCRETEAAVGSVIAIYRESDLDSMA